MVIDHRNNVCDRWKASVNGHHDHQYQDVTSFNNNINNLHNFF